MVATLIADDLTGACDAGALLVGCGPVRVVWPGAGAPAGDARVLVIDTESRSLDAAAAAARVAAAVRDLGARAARGLLFKKIDSTLRGPVGAELEALLAASGRGAALLCPAFPGQGRTVRGGALRIHGRLAHETAVGRDPGYPGATSDVAEIAGRGLARPVARLPLAVVREPDALQRALAALETGVAVADAETDADLDGLAATAARRPDLVLVGSAGLARAVAAAQGSAAPRIPLPAGGARLAVAGSVHPATRKQIAALERAGVAGIRVDRAGEADARVVRAALADGRPAFIATPEAAAERDAGEAARRLGRAAARLLHRALADLVVVTGGDSAIALLRALGATDLALRGVPADGLALADARLGDGRALPLVTKAGGFGGPDLLLSLLGHLELEHAAAPDAEGAPQGLQS